MIYVIQVPPSATKNKYFFVLYKITVLTIQRTVKRMLKVNSEDS